MVGKLISDQTVSKKTIKSTLVRWWRLLGNLVFKVLGDNLLLIEFDNIGDKSRVLKGRPWVFEENLFAVEDFDERSSPSQLSFTKASFWVRMFDLPLVCMGREVGKKLGASVGMVEEVDTDLDGVGWGQLLRVKIQIDITKPFPQERKIKLEGKLIWVTFQYERLPKFCFQCGLICHLREGCLKWSTLRNQEDTTQFGPWLRASSPPCKPERGYERHSQRPEPSKSYKSAAHTPQRRHHREDGRGREWTRPRPRDKRAEDFDDTLM